MPKINQYPTTSQLSADDMFVVETANGTCKCSFNAIKIALMGIRLYYTDSTGDVSSIKLVSGSNELTITTGVTVPSIYLNADTDLVLVNGSSGDYTITVTSGTTTLLSDTVAPDSESQYSLDLSTISDDIFITVN